MSSTTEKLKRLSASVGLVIGTLLAVSSSAYAASFTTNLEKYDGPEADIILNSITQNDKTGKQNTFSDFSYVSKVNILNNTKIKENLPEYKTKNGELVLDKKGQPIKLIYTSDPEEAARFNMENKKKGITNVEMVNDNSGAASTDKGDKASSIIPVSGMNNLTDNQIVAFMGNNNLSNIIDTEDAGSFSMNMFFDVNITEDNSGLDNFFFWERGQNSDLMVEAIDETGNIIKNSLAKVLKRTQQDTAGYSLDTTEISEAQKVGSWGLSLKELGVNSLAGIRLSAKGSGYNGPDFKVIARKPLDRTEVPESSVVLALEIVSIFAFLQRHSN